MRSNEIQNIDYDSCEENMEDFHHSESNDVDEYGHAFTSSGEWSSDSVYFYTPTAEEEFWSYVMSLEDADYKTYMDEIYGCENATIVHPRPVSLPSMKSMKPVSVVVEEESQDEESGAPKMWEVAESTAVTSLMENAVWQPVIPVKKPVEPAPWRGNNQYDNRRQYNGQNRQYSDNRGGERRPYENRGPRQDGGERRPYENRGPHQEGGERRPYENRGPRQEGGERQAYDNRPRQDGAERRPYENRGPRQDGGERRQQENRAPRQEGGEASTSAPEKSPGFYRKKGFGDDTKPSRLLAPKQHQRLVTVNNDKK